MEQPMFYQGQRVVCCQKKERGSKGSRTPLIEGKSYYVADPDYHRDEDTIYVKISGLEKMAFDQNHFIPYDTDAKLEEQIHQAMKGNLIEN